MCEAKIKRFELVELSVAANQKGKVNFQSIPQLRNQANQIIIIKAIEVYPITDYIRSQLDNSIQGFPSGMVPACVLVLYVNGEESVHMIPLSRLINTQEDNDPRPFSLTPVFMDDLSNVDFDKSYVQLSSSHGTPFVIPFAVWYIRLQRDMGGQFIEM